MVFSLVCNPNFFKIKTVDQHYLTFPERMSNKKKEDFISNHCKRNYEIRKKKVKPKFT